MKATVTRFNISYVTPNGFRQLATGNQGRHFHDTREAAEQALLAMSTVNTEDRLASIYGPQAIGTFRVDPFECYPHGGDAVGIHVEERNEEGYTFLEWVVCAKVGVMPPDTFSIASREAWLARLDPTEYLKSRTPGKG